jgi:predicted nucleotidyltransferase
MDKYKQKWTRLQEEIFRFLCINAGQTFNLRGIAKNLKKSPTAISNSLKTLKKEKIINVSKDKKMNLLAIELNRNNKKTIELKRIKNLELIYESRLVDFLEEKFPGTTIILFGSYSRGYDVWINKIEENRSDIDIAVIGAKQTELDLTIFEKILERKINLNFYEDWKIHKHLKDNILNGIVLVGGVDL